MAAQVPLTTLLAWAWIAYAIEVDNAVEAAGTPRVGRLFRISLAMWANGLRHVDEDGVTVDELRRRARAGCNLGGLERWGWISVGAGRGRDGYGSARGIKGDTVVRTTRAGAYARRLWPQTVDEVAGRWRERFGGAAVDALCDRLAVTAGDLPWSPPEVHASDGFFTHVLDGGGDDGERPLVALLGQALTGATLAQERDAAVSLPAAAGVLRVIGGEAVRVRDLPALSGLSREAIAMAVGHLQRRGLALEAQRSVRLTPAGLDALAAYRRRAAAWDDAPLREALEALLGRPEPLAGGLAPPVGGWRAERPYAIQTRRLLADPTAALPWHPMVLHRGGWPDGS
jgi:hypothetical protein